MLTKYYELFCKGLLNSTDEIEVALSNYMSLTNNIVKYIDNILCGDSISMEVLLNKWLPLWMAGGKPK